MQKHNMNGKLALRILPFFPLSNKAEEQTSADQHYHRQTVKKKEEY